jgi:acetyl-CoA acyltransferase
MGETAENLAVHYAIKREAQEIFAITSQQKAYTAQATGLFANEIIPIIAPEGSIFQQDGCLRPDSTLAALANLTPAFLTNGSVTAGTSSPLTDGAAAVLGCKLSGKSAYTFPWTISALAIPHWPT